MNKKLRILGFAICLLIILTVGYNTIKGLISSAEGPREVSSYQPIHQDVVTEAKSIPVQDFGRVKPLQTWAETNMLAMHGERSMKIVVDGKKVNISSTEWLLNVIFKPEQADKLPTFRVDNSHMLEDLGMKIKGLRERYAFNDFEAKNLIKLEQIVKTAQDKDAKLLTKKEKGFISFYTNIITYQTLKNPFNIAERGLATHGQKKVSVVFNRKEKMLQAADDVNTVFDRLRNIIAIEGAILRDLEPNRLGSISKLNFFPPTDTNKVEWSSAGKEFSEAALINYQAYLNFEKRMLEVMEKTETASNSLTPQDSFISILQTTQNNSQIKPYSDLAKQYVSDIETLQDAFDSSDPNLQLASINAFKGKYASSIKNRNEAGNSTLEIRYNDTNYFNKSIAFVLLGFILCLFRCIFIGNKAGKWFYWTAYGFASIGCFTVITGITHRSIVMGRAPIGNLYDTIPFIVAACLLILLLLELIHKKTVLLAVATFLGVAGLVLAKNYEVGQASDQLSPLVAVLNSNYWLTVHVITITLGYAGCLIASSISIVYILGRVFGIIERRPDRKYLTMITYGILGFTLVFSLIGTILGGIWAADSWGRFWGWDPKENGALLIVIWMLAILHARAGGYIREIGLHCCSIFAGIVVVFSWWHVNFLGVGLHNYGFTDDGAMNRLYIFYGLLMLTILAGIIYSIVEKDRKNMAKLRKKYEAEQLASENNIVNQ